VLITDPPQLLSTQPFSLYLIHGNKSHSFICTHVIDREDRKIDFRSRICIDTVYIGPTPITQLVIHPVSQ
jgi:hypothetical protein